MSETVKSQAEKKPDIKWTGQKIKKYMRTYWRDLLLIIVFFCTAFIMEILNRPIGRVRDLSLPFDAAIPLIPPTIIIYHTWMPLMLVILCYYFFFRRDLMRRYVITLMIGQWMADLTFPFFQTQVPRPDIIVDAETDIFSRILALTYKVDNPFCGFPSIHVTLCTITILFAWKNKQSSAWFKWIISFYYFIIAVSTLTTKQHVFLDFVGGIFYGFAAMLIALPVIRFYNRKVPLQKM